MYLFAVATGGTAATSPYGSKSIFLKDCKAKRKASKMADRTTATCSEDHDKSLHSNFFSHGLSVSLLKMMNVRTLPEKSFFWRDVTAHFDWLMFPEASWKSQRHEGKCACSMGWIMRKPKPFFSWVSNYTEMTEWMGRHYGSWLAWFGRFVKTVVLCSFTAPPVAPSMSQSFTGYCYCPNTSRHPVCLCDPPSTSLSG